MDIDNLTAKLALSAERRIKAAHSVLDPLNTRLHQSMQTQLSKDRTQFLSKAAKLDALNPLSVLTRGYSAVFDDDGQNLRSVADVKQGDTVHLRLTDGTLDAKVTEIHNDNKESTHD